MAHSEDRLRRLRTTHAVENNMGIIDLHIPYCQEIIGQMFPNHPFSLIISDVLYCLLANLWQLFDTSSLTLLSSNHWSVLRYFPSPDDACSCISLSHCVILLHSGTIASVKIFRYVLGGLDCVFGGCVAVPMHNVFNATAFKIMTHNAIESVSSKRISRLVCCMLSFHCVEIVVSFTDKFVWHVFVLALCTLHIWHQCSSIDWFGI